MTERRSRDEPTDRRPRRAALSCAVLALAGCGSGGGDPVPGEAPAADGGAFETVESAPVSTAPVETAPVGTEPVEIPSIGTVAEPADAASLPRSDVLPVERARAYRADGPWADVLADCARAGSVDEACPLDVLPFIAQATASPTIDEIMDRVVVTHDWMGERFEQLLRGAPEILLPLFASTTSVLIGSTVRPSFYTRRTGGVRLDPAYLWLDADEKATISIDEDPRTPFRTLLGFRNLGSWRRDGEPAFEYFALDDRTARTADRALLPLVRLLFHELAHANDYLPSGTAGLLDASLTPFAALGEIRSLRLSDALQARYPLASGELVDLAEVRYDGREPTPAEAAVAADYAGALFENDGAAGFYSYSSVREDFAKLFDASMMKVLYDIDVHVGFTSQPAGPEYSCDELVVGWGERNRLGDPSVAPRAGLAVASVYGELVTVERFVAALRGTDEPMVPGASWCENLEAGSAVAVRSRTPAGGSPWREPSDEERHGAAAAFEAAGR